jgi:predicted dienelactone hydrolase
MPSSESTETFYEMRARIATLFAAFVVAACSPIAAGSVAVQTADAVTLHDAARHRDIPIKLYYPSAGGPFPLIVVSPGFGGTKEDYGYLGTGWAQQGYIVAVVTHAGTDRTAFFQAGGSIARDPAKSFAQQALRTGDISFVVSSLAQLSDDVPALAGKIDASRIGVAGHSMGAGTALLLAGATAAPPGEHQQSFRDSRFRAALAMSPQGPGEEGFANGSWTHIDIPAMTMSGTLDFGVDGQNPQWRRQAFAQMRGPDKYQVTVNGARHLAFALGGEFADCILAESSAFWNRYLKGNQVSIGSDGPCAVTKK